MLSKLSQTGSFGDAAPWLVLALIFTYIPLLVPDPIFSLGGVTRIQVHLGLGLASFGSILWRFFIKNDPLKGLPRGPGYCMLSRICVESPRGKTALKWILTIPNRGLIRFHEFGGRPYLLLTTPEALIDVLSTRAGDYEKPYGLRLLFARVIGFGLLVSEGVAHKKQRRASQAFFKPVVLRTLYPTLWQKAGSFLQAVQGVIQKQGTAGKSGVVDLSEWGRFVGSIVLHSNIIMDFIGLGSMGHDLECFRENPTKLADNFAILTEPSLLQDAFLALSMTVPEWMTNPFRWGLNPRGWRANCAIHAFCEKMVKQRKLALAQSKSSVNDATNLLDILILQNTFPDQELVDQLLTMLGAGHDTSASTLMWCCYELCRNQEIQDELRAEIRAAIPSVNAPMDVTESWKAFEEQMPLLNAIIQEIIRLYPAAPVFVREAVRDTTLINYTVPKGSHIYIVPYAFNRMPEFWGADADLFKPSRWIDTDKQTGQKTVNSLGGAPTKYAHISFSHGNRACIGRPVAMMQVRCALAAIVGQFRVQLVNDHVPIQQSSFVTMRALEGVPFRLTPVEGWSGFCSDFAAQ